MAEPTLLEKVNQLQQPTTGLGAQLVGGTPKQQDMAGTKAAKQKVQKEATLAGAQRLETPGVAIGVAPTVQRAEQLAKVGGAAAGRVSKLVNQAVNNPQLVTKGPQINNTALGTALGLTSEQISAQKSDPKSKYNQAVQQLTSFATNPQNETARASALSALGALGIPPTVAASLIDTSAQALGGQISNKPLTVGQMDLKGLVPGVDSVDQLAAVLGMPAAKLSALSISDLPDVVEKVRQAEVAQVDSLKAQIAAAPAGSAQAQLLQQQLQATSAAGLETAQQKVDTAIKTINLADEIDLGGERFNAEQLMGDGELSDLVVRWLTATTPAERERLVPSKKFPGLNDWLMKNERGLGQLANDLQKGAETYSKAAETQSNIGGGAVSQDVLKDMGITTTQPGGATTTTAAAAQAAFDKTGIGQLTKANETAILDVVNKLPPEVRKTVVGLSADQIKSAYNAAKAIEADPDLAELAGVTAANGLVLDAKAQQSIAKFKPVVDALKKNGRQAWLTKPWFTSLPIEQMAVLNKYPERYKLLEQYHNTMDVIKKVASYNPGNSKSWSAMLSDIFGPGVDIKAMDKNYAEAVRLAKLGDKGAQDTKKQLEKLGYSSANTTFSKVNATVLQKLMQKQLQPGFSDIISGQRKSVPVADLSVSNPGLREAMLLPVRAAEGSGLSTFSSYLADNVIDDKEMAAAIKDGEGENPELLNTIKQLPDSQNLIASYEKAKDSYATQTINNEIIKATDGQFIDMNALIQHFSQPRSEEEWKAAVPVLTSLIGNLTSQANMYPVRKAMLDKTGLLSKLDGMVKRGRATVADRFNNEHAVQGISWDELSPTGQAAYMAGKPIDWNAEKAYSEQHATEQAFNQQRAADLDKQRTQEFGW